MVRERTGHPLPYTAVELSEVAKTVCYLDLIQGTYISSLHLNHSAVFQALTIFHFSELFHDISLLHELFGVSVVGSM